MSRADPDETLERLETELRESRTQAWDVEVFLARRHQAKIEALVAPERPGWAKRKAALSEAGWELTGHFAKLAFVILAGVWLITGQFPLHLPHQEQSQHVLPDGRPNPIPPPLALALLQP